MPTFKQIQEQILVAQNRREVLNHLVDHIEENFRPNGDQPKNFLLKEDKTAVPDSAFEALVKEMLEEVEQIDNHLQSIMDLEVTTTGDSNVKKV